MLKGSNTLELNQATMQKALEFWLEKEVLREEVTVDSVKMKNVGMADICFVVSVKEKAEDKTNAQT